MTTSSFQTNKFLASSSSSSSKLSPSEQTLVKRFQGYLNIIDGKRILVASNVNNITWEQGAWDYYDMPYTTRWSPSYKKKMIAKMYAVEEYCKKSKKSVVTLLTLTGYQGGEASIDAKGKITTRKDLFNNLTHGWRLLSNLIAKICPSLEYIWVMEPHKSGYPHLHVAMFGYIPKDMQERLTRLWSEKYQVGSAKHGIDFSVKNVNESIQSIRNYLMKYISKGIGAGGNKTWSPEEWIYHAIAWKHHHRYISMSRSISRYCTAHKLRYKFRKYIKELAGTDIGLPYIPLDKQGIINTIKQFKRKQDTPPPPEERWYCSFIYNGLAISLIRKSQDAEPNIDTVNWINNMMSRITGYSNSFIRTNKPQWILGLVEPEITGQSKITREGETPMHDRTKSNGWNTTPSTQWTLIGNNVTREKSLCQGLLKLMTSERCSKGPCKTTCKHYNIHTR